LAAAQISEGHKVRVVTLDRLFKDPQAQTLPARDELDGIEIIRIPFKGSPRYPVALSVVDHIKSADIVHEHAIDFFFDFLAWTKPFHGRPLVATTHGGFFHTPYAARLKRIWFKTLTRVSARAYDAIIACSTSDYDVFETLNVPSLVLIEDGVNTAKFHAAASPTFRKSILWIGRFSQNKRLDRFMAFAQALDQLDPEWRFIILGRPDDLQVSDVEEIRRSAKLDDKVQIIASPQNDEIKQSMNGCSFIASSSDYEGFGMTAVEGLSAGLIPLLSDIPPYQRLVRATGEGIILNYADPGQAARDVLSEAANLQGGYEARRAACMEAAARYDWTHISRKTSELYQQILSGGADGACGEDDAETCSTKMDDRRVSIGKH
ncbi:MAG: glycosyltransferase family 4 protein, partial [Pseudomonadota bacterium]